VHSPHSSLNALLQYNLYSENNTPIHHRHRRIRGETIIKVKRWVCAMFQLSEYIQLLSDALKRNETIVFGCTCAIRYSGRAESLLGEGDRVVMIKSDNALLVHQPTGNAPINYMKPGTGYNARMDDNKLVLKATNILEKENMEITIYRVHFFNAHKLQDGQAITVAGTEEDMSNMIYKNPELIEQGFKPVSQEEQTVYGFIDVLGTDKDGTLVCRKAYDEQRHNKGQGHHSRAKNNA
jgi:RecB family endonuclease NucS